ncbi:hypothetical protein [Roseibacillus ishigakijimensis]|uniref:Uncharacterized protein n=1 Tax=Roseibacillus ishigakijimensis TaxID=454146 RepID=A0A934VLU7_9BACT|nr:hypothetical protein [Roseibacillus ishigakijimensis]MBK1833612.1 hypothetical protein [Roseibacillus ishigakijimensis]
MTAKIFSLLALGSVVTHGQTVLSNNFEMGTEGWGTDDHSVSQSAGVLVVADNGGVGATRAFSDFDSPVSLLVGQQLQFSAEVFFTSSGAGVARALTIGLSNGEGATAYINRISAGADPYEEGHYTHASFNGGANNLLAGGTALGTDSGVSSIRTNTSAGDGYSHTITFTLARTGLTELELTTTAEIGNGSVRSFTHADAAASDFTFSRVDVGTFGNSDYDFNLDDVTVSVMPIPEPSTALLAAVCFPAILLRRRK